MQNRKVNIGNKGLIGKQMVQTASRVRKMHKGGIKG